MRATAIQLADALIAAPVHRNELFVSGMKQVIIAADIPYFSMA